MRKDNGARYEQPEPEAGGSPRVGSLRGSRQPNQRIENDLKRFGRNWRAFVLYSDGDRTRRALSFENTGESLAP